MTEGPLIFLSHASSDKPRIAHLATHLIDEGYRLFIDHPEKIPGFTREFVLEHRIETLWTADNNNWSTVLQDALDKCDCVLVVVSDALAPDGVALENEARRLARRREWTYEINFGQATRKIAFAKIGKVNTELLARIVEGIDAQDVTPDLDPATLAESLKILAKDRIPAAIRRGRKRGGDSGEFRMIADLLPLCVGRVDQRRAVMRSLAALRQTKIISPVLIAGPENELPDRLLEALSYEEDGERSPVNFILKTVGWPDCAPRDFAEYYAFNLCRTICGDDYAGLAAVADTLAREGHPAVIRSRIDLGEKGIDRWMLGEWLDFWKANSETFGRAALIPVVNLFLGEARPGWTECPPLEAENQQVWKRNSAAIEWLANLQGPPGQGRFVSSPITKPIRRRHAQDWADNIHDDVLDWSQRRDLAAQFDALYDSQDARDFGVNHKEFHKKIADWLGGGSR